MTGTNRPFVTFRRTLNKGISPRSEKRDLKTGEIRRAAHPGEFTENWQKSLVDHRPPYAPYCWVGAEWVTAQMRKGRVPVDFGNFDNLPANYPAEWRDKLMECLSVVRGVVEANKQLEEAKKELENVKAAKTDKRESGPSDRQTTRAAKRSPDTAGEAAHG